MAKDIAKTISLFQLINLDISLDLKTMTNKIIDNLSSMEFQSALATEAIASEIENSISQYLYTINLIQYCQKNQ